ncbi:MAG TPA: hypothetical protein VLG11_01300 [Candidatus Saccharimonadales bacterium]|nr:hypothetical protein [Candidatus Saccharimonadales bacterium]
MAEKLPFTDPAYRTPGVHTFELTTGLTITGISANTWDDYEQYLHGLTSTGQKIGDIILSPELITAAPDPAPDESNQTIMRRAQSRVAAAAEISQDYPDSTLIIGTVIPVQRAGMFANGAVYIKNGKQLGETRKMPYSPLEAEFFTQATVSSVSQPLPGRRNVLPIICSDLLFHRHTTDFKRDALPINKVTGRYSDPINPRIDTLLVSAYWQIPGVDMGDVVRSDVGSPGGGQGYLNTMQYAARTLFRKYIGLADIVVVDRVPPEGSLGSHQPIYAPYNAHFRWNQ